VDTGDPLTRLLPQAPSPASVSETDAAAPPPQPVLRILTGCTVPKGAPRLQADNWPTHPTKLLSSSEALAPGSPRKNDRRWSGVSAVILQLSLPFLSEPDQSPLPTPLPINPFERAPGGPVPAPLRKARPGPRGPPGRRPPHVRRRHVRRGRPPAQVTESPLTADPGVHSRRGMSGCVGRGVGMAPHGGITGNRWNPASPLDQWGFPDVRPPPLRPPPPLPSNVCALPGGPSEAAPLFHSFFCLNA